MTELSDSRGMIFSHFLNEKQQFYARSVLKNLECENYCFFGGIENADRSMLCVFNEYCRPENSDFPMSCITFRYNKAYSLSHRDFLGALMALNIKRETIGDIIIDEGIAQVFVIDSVKRTVGDEIRKIGSVGVDVFCDQTPLLEKNQSCKEIKGTVASLRLDCVLSFTLGISRSKAASVIASGKTEVNYVQAANSSFTLKEEDIFSVRGYGKFRLDMISGVSKKGRIHIVVLKYC